MTPSVLVVGPWDQHGSMFADVSDEVPLLHLAPMPQLADGTGPDWPYRALLAVHRDEPIEHWVAMARALHAGHSIGRVWCTDDDHSEIAVGCAEALSVPVLGAQPALQDAAGADSDTRVRVCRSAGTLTPLSITQPVRHPGTQHVLAEVETAGTVSTQVRALLEKHVPDPFLGMVELRLHAATAEVLTVRPWRASDGTRELLDGGIPELRDLLRAAIGGYPPPGGESAPIRRLSRAIAALGTEAAGTLVAIEGLEAARDMASVREVLPQFRDGDQVRPLSSTGDLLVRVSAEAENPADAYAAARAALTHLVPIIDVPPNFAGALDRVWF